MESIGSLLAEMYVARFNLPGSDIRTSLIARRLVLPLSIPGTVFNKHIFDLIRNDQIIYSVHANPDVFGE